MDAFIAHVLETFRQDAELAVRVFPVQAGVVLSFCDRVVTDVVSLLSWTSAFQLIRRLGNTSTRSYLLLETSLLTSSYKRHQPLSSRRGRW